MFDQLRLVLYRYFQVQLYFLTGVHVNICVYLYICGDNNIYSVGVQFKIGAQACLTLQRNKTDGRTIADATLHFKYK